MIFDKWGTAAVNVDHVTAGNACADSLLPFLFTSPFFASLCLGVEDRWSAGRPDRQSRLSLGALRARARDRFFAWCAAVW